MDNDQDLVFEKFNNKLDIDKQRKLFKECFPENNGTSVETIDHYNWKFHSFPHSPNSYEYIARIDDNIIGYYAALPYEYIINGKSHIVGMVCDVMTGIKARGKGVFTKLGKYSTDCLKKEGVAFTTGYPIRPEVIPGHLKAGWEKVFNLPLYIFFLKTNGILKKKSLGGLSPFINILLSFINNFIFSIKISKPYKYDVYSNFQFDEIEGLYQFLEEWKKDKKITLNKTLNFLKWRLSAPKKKYEIIIVRDNDKILGIAITTTVIKEGILSLGLLDFMVLNDNKKYASLLHSAVMKVAIKNDVEVVLLMMSKYNYKQLGLFRRGYLKSPFMFTFIIKQFDDIINNETLRDEKNWHLCWIDSDDL